MKVEYALKKVIYRFQKEICYFSQMQALAMCPYQKNYYQRMIDQRTDNLIKVMGKLSSMPDSSSREVESQRKFTLEELIAFDGSGGRPAYAAINGIVYDMCKEATWGGGTHFGLYAGKDLTSQFMGCHKGMLHILNNLPKVGILKK